MGFKNPVGQIIFNRDENITWHVVGVVKDYIAGSPYEEIPPIVIEGPGAWFNTMHIKFNPAHSTADNLAKAERYLKNTMLLIRSITSLLTRNMQSNLMMNNAPKQWQACLQP